MHACGRTKSLPFLPPEDEEGRAATTTSDKLCLRLQHGDGVAGLKEEVMGGVGGERWDVDE